jgi:type I restriction enzyme S subunit
MKRVLIGDLCDFKYGKALKKENRNEGSIPVYGSNGIVGYHDKALVNKKTIVVGRKGSIGEVHIADVPSWPIDTTYYVEFKVQDISIEWFFRLLKTLHLNELNRSVAVPGLNRDDVYRIKINLPPPDDQIRIAKLLGCVDSMIAKRKESLRLLDELLKGLFLEMFGDPVRNEKGFEVRTLSEFYIDPKNGTKCGPFGSALKKKEYVQSGVPVWNMDNISTDGKLNPDVNLWITENKYEELKGYSTQNGDVIISRAGTVGKMCVLNSEYAKSILSTNLIRVRFGEKLLPIYFVSLMTYCKGRVGKLRTGPDGSFTHMNTGILDNLRFPYPPVKMQLEFSAVVERVESIRALYQKSLSKLETLYGALSQKAFKGELDLSRIPTEKTPEPFTDAKDLEPEQPPIYLPPLDHKVMADPVAREKLLWQLFKDYFTEHPERAGSFKDFWSSIEFSVSDYMDDESTPLGPADYDKFKTWLFDLLKSGEAEQRFNEEKNRMELRTKP